MLVQRVASAAVGLPVILLLIWFGGALYTAAAAAALGVAAVEFNRARRGGIDPVSVFAALVVAGVVVVAHVGRTFWWAWIAGALIVTPLAGYAGSDEDRLEQALWLLGGVTYLGFLGSFFVRLRDIGDGREWVYLAVLATFAVDSAAYFTGRAAGRHLLAPRISPQKTIEGFGGGWIAGYVAVVVLRLAFDLDGTAAEIAILALLLPVAAAAGDLAESAIKRAMRIKDASGLVPGHGGVLDRLDSLLLTLTLTYLFVELVIH